MLGAAPDPATAVAGLAVLTLGSGVPSLCRAVLADLVGLDRSGRLFAGLAALETCGYLACALGLGGLFQIGPGRWLGRGQPGRGQPGQSGRQQGPAGLTLLLRPPPWHYSWARRYGPSGHSPRREMMPNWRSS